MVRLTITGMTCSSCSARVEKALSKVPGVDRATVNLLTNSASIEGDVDVQQLITAVRQAGYGAFQEDLDGNAYHSSVGVENRKERFFSRSLLCSLFLFIAIFYFATGTALFHFPVPRFIDNHCSLGVVQLCIALSAIFINRSFFVSGILSLLRKAPNMNTLIALGSGVSFLYSLWNLLTVIDATINIGAQDAGEFGRYYYFESSVAILFFISIGKQLEKLAKGKTTSALRALAALAPQRTIVIRDGKELEIDVKELSINDVFVVRPGQRIPADGVVVEGVSAVDESVLSGESLPVDKESGMKVYTGTLNSYGLLKCQTRQIGADTEFGKILSLTEEAAVSKAPIARLADKISGIFVPAILLIALATTVIWLLIGADWNYAIVRGITVLTISCPCVLGVATPVSVMVGMGVGARNGVLFKTAEALEVLGKVRTIAFDKTGVITYGRPQVNDFFLGNSEYTSQEIWRYIYELESRSEHPLAKAVTAFAQERMERSILCNIVDFQEQAGNGLLGNVDGVGIVAGKIDFVKQYVDIPKEALEVVQNWEKTGKTVVYFGRGTTFLAVVAISDSVRVEAPDVIRLLKNRALEIRMITGDSVNAARAIGQKVGIDAIVAGVLPGGKEKTVRELAQKGRVAFVGDGINDAPALSRADVGIAVGKGTDVALNAADVILISDNLESVASAYRLSRYTLRNIYENFFWAFGYNLVGIPLAAGFLKPVLGWTFSPAFGAFAMSMSSLCVISNALRLNCIKLNNANSTLSNRESVIEQSDLCDTGKITSNTMKRTLKIEGMMCPHCEMRVKKVLDALENVSCSLVDHKQGVAVVEILEGSEDMDEILRNTVTEQGYDVLAIE